ncbi:hypothetical protein [Methylobacterium planeticum]|uniref:Uncharacterized protein n=1 Tax=Methylobacterium planeticum TaxID=2615211 RepID=A0A6N6MGH2_9HYPH|nr:hypothetical protein [Methylobacterium planeticum]KAB1068492.1 hypothetical protein F6X51_26910 [Methylobacterium planeticum]
MPIDKTDTQAQRMPAGKPESKGLANSPQDTATGTVRPQDGPMERAGTEAEAAARGETGPSDGAKPE